MIVKSFLAVLACVFLLGASTPAFAVDCPEGYKKIRQGEGKTYCSNQASRRRPCEANHYKCGEKAMQCCHINTNNPCPDGLSPCSLPSGPGLGSGNKLCCG